MHLPKNKKGTRRIYTYEIINYDVVDGDTIKAYIDMGFSCYKVVTVRMSDLDTPEIRSASQKEKAGAYLAKEVLKCLLEYASTDRIELVSTSVDMYGRSVGTIYCSKFNDNLNHIMTEIGAGRLHYGSQARTPWVEGEMDVQINKCNTFLNHRESKLNEWHKKGLSSLNRNVHIPVIPSNPEDNIYDPFDSL